jgi:SHS2 domain-containing protein
MSRRGFRHLSHTADVGLAAWGPTLAEAFAEAIRGTVAVTYDLQRIRPAEERVVTATATDTARLLVSLLDDVLYLLETEGFVPANATIALSDGHAEARLFGEAFNPLHHRRSGPQVKAITYHDLRIAPGPPARVRLILDI